MIKLIKTLTIFIISLFISIHSFAAVSALSSCDNSLVIIRNYTDKNMVIDSVVFNTGSHADNLGSTTILPNNQVIAYAHPNGKQQAMGSINISFEDTQEKFQLSYSFVGTNTGCVAGTRFRYTNTTNAGWKISYHNGSNASKAIVIFNRYDTNEYAGFSMGPE